MSRKIILIDLDGVLNQYDGEYNENEIPSIKNGADEFLDKLSKNFDLKIFTTRNLLLVSKWLIENNIDGYIKDVTNIKTPAYLYIDDRCLCFRGNYTQMLKQIYKFDVYWRKSL